MTKELTNKIFKDTAFVVAANFINFGSTFIIAVFISRFLGVEELGEFTFIFAFALIISAVSDFGFSTLLIRKLNESKYDINRLLNSVNIFKCTSGIISIMLLLAAGYLFSSDLYNFVFAAGIASVIPRAIQSTYESSIRSKQNQVLPSLIRSINSLLQLLTAYYLLFTGKGMVFIFLMLLLTECLTAIVFYFSDKAIKQQNTNPDPAVIRLKELLRESSPFFINNFLTLSMPRVVIIMTGYILTQAAIGVFSAASRFVNSVGLISGALFNSYYPLISSVKDNNKLKFRLTEKVISNSFAAGVLISALLFILSGQLIDLSFRIEESKPILRLLSFTALPILAGSVIKAFLYSHYKERYLLKLNLVWWITNSAGSAAAMFLYGLTGLAVVTLLIEYCFFLILIIKFNSERSLERVKGSFEFDNRSFHDNISVNYDKLIEENPSTIIVRDLFHQRLINTFQRGSKVLELGCGTGIDTVFAASKGITVTAVDISEKMIGIAKTKSEKAGLKNVSYINCDMENIVPAVKSTKFDGVFSDFNGVNYVNDPVQFALNISEILNPGGRVIFTMLNRFCLQEVFYNLLKLDPVQAYRAVFKRKEILLTDVRLYFPGQFSRFFSGKFTLERITGTGFLLPPHSFFGLYHKMRAAIPLLKKVENLVGSRFPFYNISDHYIIELKKI